MINKIADLILRFHGGFVAGIILLSVILFFWFIRIEIGSSLAGLMPPSGDAERDFLERMHEELESDYFLIIAITDDNVFSFPTLSKIQNVTARISELPAVDRVLSLSTASIIKGNGDEIFIQDISKEVPTTEREIAQFRSDVLQNPLYARNLVSDDGRTTLINVFINRHHPEEMLRYAIEHIQELALVAFGPEKICFHGLPAITSSIYKMLISDLSTYIPFIIIVIVIILFISFGSWRYIAISLVFISIPVVWTYASMAFFKVPIYILTAFIPPIIGALGISYGIHIFAEYFKQRTLEHDSKRIIRNTIRNIMLATWLSVITTAIGFASLSLVNVVAIRELSIFLVVGSLSLLFLVTFFIPSVLIYIRPRPELGIITESHLPEKPSSRFINLIVRYHYSIIILAAFIAVPGAFGAMRLNADTGLDQMFKRSAAISQATEIITRRLHGTTGISAIIEANYRGALEDPSLLKSIETLQSFLEQQPSISKTTSIVDYLKVINKAYHNNNPNYYVLPASGEEISQYLLMYSLADPQRMLDRYIDYNNRIARISFRSTLTGSASLMELKNLIEDRCSELFSHNTSCKVTSDSLLIASTAQIVSREILFSFALAASVISIIMFLLFRSFKMGVIAMIPNLLPLISILALMGWAEIDFNIGTSIIVCVAIGISVDNTIHFLVRYFHELKLTNHYLIRQQTNIRITADQIKALRTTFNRVKRPIIVTSVIIFFGFSVLAFSQFVPIMFFGTLTALTMVFCLICDLILLPAIIASVSI